MQVIYCNGCISSWAHHLCVQEIRWLAANIETIEELNQIPARGMKHMAQQHED